jgi:uncharacterized protein YndB with AHSA1/START domain
MDLRTGGKYLNSMRSPEGQEFWSAGVYREIVPLERIVFTDSFADEKGTVVPASHYNMPGEWPLELLVTVTFEDAGGGTRMTLRHEGIPAGIMADNTKAGWNESFDKLAEALANLEHAAWLVAVPGKQEIVMTSVLDGPRELVFKAYTEPGLIEQWWGPRRYTTVVDRLEARRGGVWRFLNRDSQGREYGFHGVYHEIRPPERIVSTFEYEGTPGQVSLETTIFEEHAGRTTVTSRSVFQSVADRDEMLKEGMEEGAIETMDRLAELLSRRASKVKAA